MLNGRSFGAVTCGLLLLLSSCAPPAAGPAGNETNAAPEAGPEAAVEAATEISEAVARIAVGDAAPGFSLKDQHGATRTLGEFLEGGKVALVFHRSADW